MSLLPGLTQSAPGVSLFAPASGGGGGGGGPNLTVSTITVNPAGLGIVFPNNTSTFQMTYATIQDENNASQNTVCFINNTPSVDLGLDVAVGGLYICGDGGNFDSAPSGFLDVVSGDLTFAAPTTGNIVLNSELIATDCFVSSLTTYGSNNTAIQMSPYPGWGSGPFQTTPAIQFAIGGGAFDANTAGIGAATNNDLVLQGISTINLLTSTLMLNGAPFSGGGGSVPANLAVSSLTVSEQQIGLSSICQIQAADPNLYTIQVVDSNSATVAGLSIGLVGGRNQVYIDSNAQIPNSLWVSSITRCAEAFVSSFNVSSINGAAPGGTAISTFPGLTVSSPTAAILTLNGGANEIVARSDNTAGATIWATGIGGLALSTITTLNGGAPLVAGNTPQASPFIQSGYASAVPYASTILFPVPYNNDNITVMLTATNAGVSGGANPNISLASAFGTNGVSSIGFQADTRDNGVGYAGSYHWMAMPRC
jgi:hypothetical protein